MKILRTVRSMNPIYGGVAEAIRLSSNQLISMGHDVEVASLDMPHEPFLASVTHPVLALGDRQNNFGYSSKFIPWLVANYRRFDVVIIEGLWQYHSLATWKVLHQSSVPYFVFPHGMLDPWFKRNYTLKHLKKWLYWPFVEYRVLRDANAVLFTCKEELQLARESFCLYSAREQVAPLGIFGAPVLEQENLIRSFMREFPTLRTKRLVLFLGRIHEKKGCDHLIDAIAQIISHDPNIHLVMAGPDQTGWIPLLQARAVRLGIDQDITWTNMLQGEVKWGALFAAEVFCLPSHQENFGIVVAEALSCGKPVLISNKVNIWREVESDAAGFVADDTVAGTVQNLQRWLALDAPAYNHMAERSRQCFLQRFHIQRAAVRLVEIIREHSR